MRRETPCPGDLIILLGGKTGRDGCGGATGSSKEHTEESILTAGAEVQKGNPPEERKIQRLFRNPQVSTLIKRCNDFGAGGVSVAIGELTEGLEINLDVIPKKYEGLDGTELAISESQERMAVVVTQDNAQTFIELARSENLEATIVATVTAEQRLKMHWRGQTIVDVSREFLNTNGVKQSTQAYINSPQPSANFFKTILPASNLLGWENIKQAWLANLQDLNVCSQKGLVERFDSTIGAGSVLLPFGGKFQITPAEGMVAKIPVLEGDTTTGTVMTYGYNPKLSTWSPFHGALYAVIEAVTKVVVMGGNYQGIRLTLQEYFEKLGKDAEKWGKPLGALLGAFYAQQKLGIPAIGGKDSMSGTFKDLNVPPTLVAFAVNVVDVSKVVSPEFKQVNSKIVLLPVARDQQEVPIFEQLTQNYNKVTALIENGQVLAAHSVRLGGIAEAISKMAFGNKLGMIFTEQVQAESLFTPEYGSIVLELDEQTNLAEVMGDVAYQVLGHTQEVPVIELNGTKIMLAEALEAWTKPLEKIFPTQAEEIKGTVQQVSYSQRNTRKPVITVAQPRIFMPVFPGTNCEYDTAKAFEKAGGKVETLVMRNLSAAEIELSIAAMVKGIEQAQIIMLPGGFSGGDEPDGSGKFIATAFRNPRVSEAVMQLLNQRDGLMLGICNGFQALIKLGLVPYGKIREITSADPTLTHNGINRHVSCMVNTKVVSTLSPWFSNLKSGEVHTIAVSHGEGRFMANQEVVDQLIKNGQIATQYVDATGQPTYDIAYNPNGSMLAIEGITSPDGRVLGKMGHSERLGSHVARNVPGLKDQQLFAAGVNYFK